MAVCSKGWQNRCPEAHSPASQCKCACRGTNHGIWPSKKSQGPLFDWGQKVRSANYDIMGWVGDDGTITIKDLGPWDQFLTVTNDAENVVAELVGHFPTLKRIFYFDSQGHKDELLVRNGKFAGFAPGRAELKLQKGMGNGAETKG